MNMRSRVGFFCVVAVAYLLFRSFEPTAALAQAAGQNGQQPAA
jgi:hypothetical protein